MDQVELRSEIKKIGEYWSWHIFLQGGEFNNLDLSGGPYKEENICRLGLLHQLGLALLERRSI